MKTIQVTSHPKTVNEMIVFLNQFDGKSPINYTDGDRVFDIEVYMGRVKGQDHPSKKWDVRGVFIEVDK